MTNRTNALPRSGAGVRFGIPDAPACSNRTTNRTPSEREPDNEPDNGEPDTRHAHEPDNIGPLGTLAGAPNVEKQRPRRIAGANGYELSGFENQPTDQPRRLQT